MNNQRKKVPTGIKAITKILLPKEHWKTNNIHQLRFDLTSGLPPKTQAPHITLLDPISSSDRFAAMVQRLSEVAKNTESFDITLRDFSFFTHAKRGFTLYLIPEIEYETENPLLAFQKRLHQACEGLNFLENKLAKKFNPHVSIAKFSEKETLQKTLQRLKSDWTPIRFTVKEIYVMSKLLHDTVVRHVIPFGSSSPYFETIPFPPDGQCSININHIPTGMTNQQLLEVFRDYGAIQAEVIFKTTGGINKKEKGWGHVLFGNKEQRDTVLRQKFCVQERHLEIFPCD